MDEQVTNLTADRRQFTRQLAERRSQPLAESPGYADPGPRFPALAGKVRPDAILQPPKPQIEPSPRILERVMGHDLDPEAAD
jgi:hypothetical protein